LITDPVNESRGVGQVIERGGELTNSLLKKSGIFGLSNFVKWK